MFPVRDHNPSHKFPLITLLLIAANIYVFLNMLTQGFEEIVSIFALIPTLVDFTNIASLTPFITSMYLHGGFFHLISNMWFLWIFGDNIEAALGSIQFFLFYTICGLAAGFLQYIVSPDSSIPMLGASGAIAGVLGAYLVYFPQARIDTFVVGFGGFLHQIPVNAGFMLVYWFILQLLSGAASIGAQGGGVAWWAHIGGFAAGYLLAHLLPPRRYYIP